MENQLIVIEDANIPELFTANGCDPLISRIKAEVAEYEADVSTGKGRKEIASLAHKIRKSKTVIDNAGKNFVAAQKAQIKAIDTERKRVREELDIMALDVRQPLTEWEEAEETKRIAEELAKEIADSHEIAIEQNDLFTRQREVERKEAELLAREEEQREVERVAQAEADRIKREEGIRIAADLKAKREAAEQIHYEKERADRVELEKIAAVEAEATRIKREIAEAELLVKKEAEYIKAEKARMAKNIEHQLKVNHTAKDDLIARVGIPESIAIAVVDAIRVDRIRGISINY